MTTGEARVLVRRHIAEVLARDLDGKGEDIMKEVWEQTDTDAAFQAANGELRAIIEQLIAGLPAPGEHVCSFERCCR